MQRLQEGSHSRCPAVGLLGSGAQRKTTRVGIECSLGPTSLIRLAALPEERAPDPGVIAHPPTPPPAAQHSFLDSPGAGQPAALPASMTVASPGQVARPAAGVHAGLPPPAHAQVRRGELGALGNPLAAAYCARQHSR